MGRQDRTARSSRRRAGRAIALAAAVGLTALYMGVSGTTPGASPPLRAAVVAQPKTPIKHIVVIFKENRSFDEYFGQFPGANGATTAVNSKGVTVKLAQTPDPLPNDVWHMPSAFKTAYDGGRMDGFDRERGAVSATGQPLALSQMTESQIPNYWAYARTYALGGALRQLAQRHRLQQPGQPDRFEDQLLGLRRSCGHAGGSAKARR
jgi:phospholipase C